MSTAYDEYLKQAQQIYAPQFDFLDQQAASTKKQATTSKSELTALYNALSKDILAQQPGINQNYSTGIGGVNAAYGQGIGDINKMYDTSRDSQLAILKQLGIEQAAPNILQDNANGRTFIEQIMKANQQGTTNAMRQMNQADLSFNRETANSSRLAGVNQRSQIDRQLLDILNQISGKRADIMSNVNQTAMGMQSEAAKLAQAQAEAAQRQQNWQDEFNLRLAEDAAKQAAQKQDTSKLDPGSQVNQLALQLYGNPQAAGNAVAALRDAWAMDRQSGGEVSGNITSPVDLYNEVMARLIKANGPKAQTEGGKLSQLADLMYGLLHGKGSAY